MSKPVRYLSLFLILALGACKLHQRPPKPVAEPGEPKKEILVGIFVYDGVYNTEFIAPYDIFQHAGSIAEQWNLEPAMRVVTIAPELKPVKTAEGLRILPDHAFIESPVVDILVIPSGEDYLGDIQNRLWIRWVADMANRAEFSMSHCWGAFLLAAAGQLEFKKATTYPPSIDDLKELFPNVETVKNVRYIQDGRVITSAGGLASYEASLHLVQFLYGQKMAERVAAGLVFAPDNINYSMPEEPSRPRTE